MRLLTANIPLPQNRFLVDLNTSLQRHVDLVHDHKAFWQRQGDYDIVHLHFPEYLTYEIEQAYSDGLSDELIAEIEARLRYWSERSTLVITRHNLLPHGARSDPRWAQLYEMVYRFVDGVVHFALPSVEEFKQRYRDTDFVHGHPAHCVVPHHNFTSLPNTVGRDEARRRLHIPRQARVVLVFGTIRSEQERRLILDSFRRSRVPHKLLLVSRWRENLAKVRWIRLKYWLRDLNRLYFRMHPRYHFNYGFVEEQDTQLYLNAADVLLIPRLHVLNSGNLTMGMTFGKVVVGPDSLDVGRLLKTTGNVVFDPNRPGTAVAAIECAIALAAAGEVGPANRSMALSEWSVDQCADQYIQFFNSLTRQRKVV